MNRRTFIFLAALAAGASFGFGQASPTNLAFTVSMPEPANHIFHVAFRGDGLKGELQDFKMPVWSPGYYGVGDYSRNVLNFQAQDGAGHALPWEKVSKNTW